MSDSRLSRKVDETRTIAAANGLDLRAAPLLTVFEMPIWGAGIATHEIGELARQPGTAVAVLSSDPLQTMRRAVAAVPHLHVIAERGLVCGLSGGATLHVYPQSQQERESFAVALFAGAAPTSLRLALTGLLSSGRQEVTFEDVAKGPACSPRELWHAVRNNGGTAAFGSEDEQSVVVDDVPAELEAVRAALTGDLAGHGVRVVRMPSGRFRLSPDAAPRGLERERIHVIAQEIAISCDRFVEAHGRTAFGFVTEPVARWEYGPEAGARRLASEIFDAPDTVITQLGLHPFAGEGTLFFAYEGSETVWEAANKGITCITVRDILEYGRILHAIRRGE